MLWWLLRAVPPAPGRRAFPGVRLLLGLTDPEKMPERTPWWLLLLRMAALAAAILAFAGPVLNPRPEGSDAAARWCCSTAAGATRRTGSGGCSGRPRRSATPARAGRPAAVVTMAAPPLAGRGRSPWRAAAEWSERLAGVRRGPGRRTATPGPTGSRRATRPFETLWLSDGIGTGGETALARALVARGPVTLVGAAGRRRWR